MADKTMNPRYPHQCVIYRHEGATSFSEGQYTEMHRGCCRKSSSDNIRSFNVGSNTTGKVDTTDYRVSMPGIIKGIRKGDLVDVVTEIGEEKEMRIVNFDYSRLGITEIEDENGKKKVVRGGTAVLCNIPSN